MTTTAEIFEAFLHCQTKAFLKASGILGDHREFGNWQRLLAEDFRRKCCIELLSHFREDEHLSGIPLLQVFDNAKCSLATDCIVQTTDIQTNLQALERLTPSGKIHFDAWVPIRFIPSEKITQNDKLVLAFDALALTSACGKIPPFGKIFHGSDHATAKVHVAALMTVVRDIVGRIATQQTSQTPPQLILNKHCSECEFRTRCHQIAVEKDELSLLSGMTEKERKRQHNKGIFTVTQLSYTFHARRKPKRYALKPDKYNHALKALAIRDHKIYISGRPELKLEGTPVYLDVEGIPDQDFYYLIGLRVKSGDVYHQYSFWANDATEEKEIWISFLQTLVKIENPQLIHYGSYETQFLKRMKRRYLDTIENSTFINRLIKESVNILSVIYAQIYFPTHSNGLKETAQYLGFHWSDSNASGFDAVRWRYEWEFSKDSKLKQRLITYNTEDCEAAERVTSAVSWLYPRSIESNPADTSIVHTDSMKLQSPYHLGDNSFVIREMEGINRCAYWNYQRERVLVKSSDRLKYLSRRNARQLSEQFPINEAINFELRKPTSCPNCGGSTIYRHDRRSKVIQDLRFGSNGVERWIVQYFFNRYRCCDSKATFYSRTRPWSRSKIGLQLLVYIVYCLIELCLPQAKIAKSLNQLFRLRIDSIAVNRQKQLAARLYCNTYDAILNKLIDGKLIHADETRVSIDGKISYVWVLTNLEEVIYIYAETREGDKIQIILKGFKGVLVSDFYAVYDSVDCPQQKCLIHLMRDMNDDLLHEPYNQELKELAQKFTLLLKPMTETIDRYGLKARFLREHMASVERFYSWLSESKYETETATRNKKRFEKNRGKLFTFLDYDDIPWNNNNAEHAIKAFATIRRVIGGTSSEKGIREYLTLLSVSETCKYKGVSFLEFLRSGEKDIDRFIEEKNLIDTSE